MFWPQKIWAVQRPTWWKYQSVDTMKYSRDVAREKLNDASFDKEIEEQVKQIASTGATHISLGTPYDDEFLPFLRRWVNAARTNNLSVWYRGNFSGWEGWFGYQKISQAEHLAKVERFVSQNPTLFVDGDIFTACPECENGGPGDPRHNGKLGEYRKFIIDEYQLTQKLFNKLNKKVVTNLASSNGDVARLVFDRDTVQAMGAVITIDHYVATPEKLINDIRDLHRDTGAFVVLGEVGVPIVDIHGQMSEEQQAAWLTKMFEGLLDTPEVIGINYWTSRGGSTQLWNSDGSTRKALEVIKKYYSPMVYVGRIVDQLGVGIKDALVSHNSRAYYTDKKGNFAFPVTRIDGQILVSAPGYYSQGALLEPVSKSMTVELVKEKSSFTFRIRLLIKKLLYDMLQGK